MLSWVRDLAPTAEAPGKTESISLGEASANDVKDLIERGSAKCSVCKGSGMIPRTQPCEACGGLGREYRCAVCGDFLNTKEELCERCAKKPLVHVLDQAGDTSDLVTGEIYQGKVSGIASFGAFVDLNDQVRGLAHNISSRPSPR